MITEAYSKFFKELAKNNTKEWFHANKTQYESEVKAPFISLLDALIPTLVQWDNRILPDAKKAMFRIHRDVRFSKDKSPYNLIMKAGLSPNGKKSELPGYYLGIDANQIHVGGGLFMLGTPALKAMRQYISNEPEKLIAIVNNQEFKNAFGTLQGEKSKRIDKALMPIAEKTNLIYHKQFYAFKELPLSDFYGSDHLTDVLLKHFKIIRELNTYLNSAF